MAYDEVSLSKGGNCIFEWIDSFKREVLKVLKDSNY